MMDWRLAHNSVSTQSTNYNLFLWFASFVKSAELLDHWKVGLSRGLNEWMTVSEQYWHHWHHWHYMAIILFTVLSAVIVIAFTPLFPSLQFESNFVSIRRRFALKSFQKQVLNTWKTVKNVNNFEKIKFFIFVCLGKKRFRMQSFIKNWREFLFIFIRALKN